MEYGTEEEEVSKTIRWFGEYIKEESNLIII